MGNNLNKTIHSQKAAETVEPKLPDSLNLQALLANFTLPEVLNTFNCSFCKCTKEARKQLTMKNLPIVCCFHLKRFEHSNKVHKKISTHISFPEILDMSPFMSKPTATTESKPNMAYNDSKKYFLFAVVNHMGTLESGHYTSFIRLDRDQWFECDDHIISKASLSDVMKSEGYLLFYHKIWNEFDWKFFFFFKWIIIRIFNWNNNINNNKWIIEQSWENVLFLLKFLRIKMNKPNGLEINNAF